jgi:hypothetical protein
MTNFFLCRFLAVFAFVHVASEDNFITPVFTNKIVYTNLNEGFELLETKLIHFLYNY